MQKEWAGVKIQVTLIRAKWLRPDDCVRISPKLQATWGTHGQAWGVPAERGLRRENSRYTDSVLGTKMMKADPSGTNRLL